MAQYVRINPAAEVNIAQALEVALSPRYQGWDWKQRWEHVQHELGQLTSRHPEELSGQAISRAHRDLESFYIQAYHINDPLRQKETSLGLQRDTIKNTISSDPDLALLADLANLDKHYKLNRSPRSGAVPKIVSAQGVRSGSGEGGWRLKVTIEHDGKLLDGLDVARAAVEAWRRHLKGWGLIP